MGPQPVFTGVNFHLFQGRCADQMTVNKYLDPINRTAAKTYPARQFFQGKGKVILARRHGDPSNQRLVTGFLRRNRITAACAEESISNFYGRRKTCELKLIRCGLDIDQNPLCGQKKERRCHQNEQKQQGGNNKTPTRPLWLHALFHPRQGPVGGKTCGRLNGRRCK